MDGTLPDHVRALVDEIEREVGEDEDGPAGAGALANASAAEDAVREILVEIGEDPDRQGLRGTPGRVRRMYHELTAGYHVDPDRLVNGALFDVDYSEMVVVKDIPFYSLCEHHLLPFFGQAHVAYIPAGRVIGLSKIPRIVEMYARRLQVQETLTRQVADFLMERLQPKGVGVVMEASHLCAVMRGVLAQEIHHRVKNNLQSVASLLRLQARTENVDARKSLSDSVNRILAIAAVHEVLTEHREDDVELSAVPGWTEHVDLDADPGEVRRKLDDYGLAPVSLSAHSDLTTREGLEHGIKGVRWAADFGIPIVNTAVGGHQSADENEAAFLANIGELADLTNIGTLFAFILVCLGVNVLRRVNPERPRPFRVPFVPIFPLLGVFMCLALMLSLPVMTWIRFLAWLGIGLLIYFLYSVRHSKLRRGIDVGETEDIPPPFIKT